MAAALPGAGQDDPTSAMMQSSSQQQRAEEGAGFSLKCIKDKRVPIGVTVAVAVLLIIIIALAAKRCPPCPSCPPPIIPSCLKHWVGYGEKCFYFAETPADWNRSQIFCLSSGAHLATVDSPEELSFLLRYGRASHFWIGLQREGTGPWKWFNGSLFNNLFDIRGMGQCAYLNEDGISSDWCSQLKSSICSHLQKHHSRNASEVQLKAPSWQR